MLCMAQVKILLDYLLEGSPVSHSAYFHLFGQKSSSGLGPRVTELRSIEFTRECYLVTTRGKVDIRVIKVFDHYLLLLGKTNGVPKPLK